MLDDYQKVIDRATKLLWRKGYSRTSLRDSLRAMGIGEGSFYNTVKSKRRLYLECLRHCNDSVSRRRLDALRSHQSVKEGIRAFFRRVLDELDDPKTPQLCLLAGSLSGDGLGERELRQHVFDDMKAFTECFEERLEFAKKSGELPRDFDVEVTAQLVVTHLLGMFRVIRVLASRAGAERQIEALLRGLGL